MRTVFRAAWNAFKQLKKSGLDINVVGEKEDFIDTCCSLYRNFTKAFMADADDNVWGEFGGEQLRLDRHKVGAIIAIVGSKGNFIQSTRDIEEDKLFIGRYSIPILVALQFIIDDVNTDLENFGIKPMPIEIYIPDTKVCTTDYIVSLSRRLYLEEQRNIDELIRVLGLANVFFLMEECTLLKNNIPMEEWLKKKREQITHYTEGLC